MGARLRGFLVLASLMAAMAGMSFLLVAASGSVLPEPGRQAIAGTVKDLSLFKGEVLISAAGGFSDKETGHIRDSVRVAEISAVRTGFLPVAGRSSAYPVIPVETMAVDPRAYAAAVGRSGSRLVAMLQSGVVLSRTGASLRKLSVGDPLELTNGQMLRVRGIVDDHVLAGYEAAINAERGKPLGISRVSYALVRPRGSHDTLRASVRRLLAGRQLSFQLPGTLAWFRAGNGALPLAEVKLRFGEFAVAQLGDPVPSPAWASANLATRSVPVLGEVRCHRLILDDLSAAMADLQRRRLASLVDTGAFRRGGGCLGSGAKGELSSAAWGIGLDLGASGNGRGRTDQRLVAVMAHHGFTWGGRWLPARTGHFEWVGAGA